MVDNVTEVFRSWREGTVIRSWLLDLLVAALDERRRTSTRSAATPTTPARAGGPSRQAIDNAVADCRRSPRRCTPGSSPARTTARR